MMHTGVLVEAAVSVERANVSNKSVTVKNDNMYLYSTDWKNIGTMPVK